jgi:hypothetical protein
MVISPLTKCRTGAKKSCQMSPDPHLAVGVAPREDRDKLHCGVSRNQKNPSAREIAVEYTHIVISPEQIMAFWFLGLWCWLQRPHDNSDPERAAFKNLVRITSYHRDEYGSSAVCLRCTVNMYLLGRYVFKSLLVIKLYLSSRATAVWSML